MQAVETVVAGILHDIVDDTCESLHGVEEQFGNEVAKLVAGVSRLSYINQVLQAALPFCHRQLPYVFLRSFSTHI